MDARDAVSRILLFRDADPADIEAIAAIAEPRAYAAGDHVYEPLHPADAFLAILIGQVEITSKGKDLPVATIASGQSLGELAFFARDTHLATAYSREITRALRIPFAGIDRLMAERPQLALVVYRNAAHHFARHLLQMAADRDRPYI